MRTSVTFAGLATGVLLAACTVGPNYKKPDLPAPAAFGEAVSTVRTTITAAPPDLSAWWTALNDPVLDDLAKRALADNPDLQVAASRVREARQQVRVAAAAELPTVNGSANAVSYNSNRQSSSSSAASQSAAAQPSGLAGLPIPSHLSLYSAGFDASWEVDLFGGTRRSIEAAKANQEAAEWARRDGQVSLLAEVANDYLTLRAVQARIAIGRAELARQQGLFQLIRARRESGFTTELDVNQQTGQVAAAAAQIPQLQAQASAEVHALSVLVGRPPEALAATLALPAGQEVALPPTPPSLPVGLPSDLLQRRPDVREAERRLAAANAQVGVQVAAQFPKINLLGLAAFASNDIGRLFDQQNFSTIGLGMGTVPVFTAGKTQASIRAAKEERTQAAIAYRSAALVAFRDVEDALSRYRSEDERRQALARAVTAADNSLRIAQDQYRAGTVTFINVLQAENALLNSRDQLTQSDAQALSELVALYKALGGGWSASG